MSEVSDRWVVWSADKKRAGRRTVLLGVLALPLSLGFPFAASGILTHFNFSNSWMPALPIVFLVSFAAGVVTLITGLFIRERAEVPCDVVQTTITTPNSGATRLDQQRTIRDDPDFSLRLSLGTSAVSLSVPMLAWSNGWIRYNFLHLLAGLTVLFGLCSVLHTISGLVSRDRHTVIEIDNWDRSISFINSFTKKKRTYSFRELDGFVFIEILIRLKYGSRKVYDLFLIKNGRRVERISSENHALSELREGLAVLPQLNLTDTLPVGGLARPFI